MSKHTCSHLSQFGQKVAGTSKIHLFPVHHSGSIFLASPGFYKLRFRRWTNILLCAFNPEVRRDNEPDPSAQAANPAKARPVGTGLNPEEFEIFDMFFARQDFINLIYFQDDTPLTQPTQFPCPTGQHPTSYIRRFEECTNQILLHKLPTLQRQDRLGQASIWLL